MKKTMLATMVIGASALLLMGCGKQEEKKVEDYGKADRVKKAELVVYAPKGKNSDWLDQTIKSYNKEFDTELSLKMSDVAPTAITQKMTPLLVGNETLPDLAMIQDSDVTGLLDKFPTSFENMTENGFAKEHEAAIFPAKIDSLKGTSPKNNLFGVPQDLGMVMMFYRNDYFEKAGLEIDSIKDWDDLIEAGKVIKKKVGVNLMALDANGENSMISHMMQQQDTPLIDKNGNTNLHTDAAKKAIKIVDKMREADIVSYYSSDKDRYPTFQESAVIIEGTWLAGNMTNNYPDQSGSWRVAPIVGFSKENPGKNPVSGGSSWYVGANADNKIAAMQFLDYAIQDMVSQNDLLERGSASTVLAAYDGEAAKTGYPFFGDQAIYGPIFKASENSIQVYQYPYVSDVSSYLKMAVYDYWEGKDLDKSLKEQADQMAQKYNIEVN